MPDPGVLVQRDNERIFMRDRIRHVLFARRTIVWQLLFGIKVAAKHVEPAGSIIVGWIDIGIRVHTPNVANVVISPANVHSNVGIINGFHDLGPRSELRLKSARAVR